MGGKKSAGGICIQILKIWFFFNKYISTQPIIGSAKPDFYQKNCSVGTLPPSPIQWLTQTGPWIPRLTPFKPLESELSLKTRRNINYKHVKIADDKSIGRLWKHQISIYNSIVSAWFACSWIQVKILCKWQCLSFNPWKRKLNDVFLELQQVGNHIAKSAHCSLKNQFSLSLSFQFAFVQQKFH